MSADRPFPPTQQQQQRVRPIVTLPAVLVVLAMASACSGAGTAQEDAAAAPGAANAATTAAPPFQAVATTRQLMEQVMEPAANVYWESVGSVSDERGSRDIAPTSDSAWIRVRNAATLVAESGNLLMLAPRALNQDEWMRLSRDLITVATKARDAAERRDPTAVFDVGAELYDACVNCHKVYLVGDKAVNPALRPAGAAPR